MSVPLDSLEAKDSLRTSREALDLGSRPPGLLYLELRGLSSALHHPFHAEVALDYGDEKATLHSRPVAKRTLMSCEEQAENQAKIRIMKPTRFR